jgi:hypothetical protein
MFYMLVSKSLLSIYLSVCLSVLPVILFWISKASIVSIYLYFLFTLLKVSIAVINKNKSKLTKYLILCHISYIFINIMPEPLLISMSTIIDLNVRTINYFNVKTIIDFNLRTITDFNVKTIIDFNVRTITDFNVRTITL